MSKKHQKTQVIQPSDEIQAFVKMNYNDLINALNKKYGNVPGDYFIKGSGNKAEGKLTPNNAIKRGKEGLFIHHNLENKYLSLGNAKNASITPWEAQEAKNLVYCNFIEHLLLHIKILIEFDGVKMDGVQVGRGGAFTFLIPQMNDLYSGFVPATTQTNNGWLAIKNKLGDYLCVMEYLIKSGKATTEIYTSYFSKQKLWDNANNIPIYDMFVSFGAIPYNKQALIDNDNRMKANIFATSQGKIDKIEKKPHWLRWYVIAPFIAVWIILLVSFIV